MGVAALIGAIEGTLVGISALQQVIAGLTRQAAILHVQGEISPEQLAEVMQRAGVSDAQVDAEVEAARQRLASAG